MQLRVVTDQPWNVPADVLVLPFVGDPVFEGELAEIDRRAAEDIADRIRIDLAVWFAQQAKK